MDDGDANQAERTDPDPLSRHVEHVGGKCKANDQDDVTDQVNSERHRHLPVLVIA